MDIKNRIFRMYFPQGIQQARTQIIDVQCSWTPFWSIFERFSAFRHLNTFMTISCSTIVYKICPRQFIIKAGHSTWFSNHGILDWRKKMNNIYLIQRHWKHFVEIFVLWYPVYWWLAFEPWLYRWIWACLCVWLDEWSMWTVETNAIFQSSINW